MAINNFPVKDDTIFEILLRLPRKSIYKFKSVSKAWYNILCDPSFIRTYNERPKPSKLLLQSSYLKGISTVTSIYNDGISKELFNDNIVVPIKYSFGLKLSLRAYCDGLLCFFGTRYSDDEILCQTNDDTVRIAQLRNDLGKSLTGYYYLHNPVTKQWVMAAPCLNNMYKQNLLAFYLCPLSSKYKLLQYIPGNESKIKFEIFTIGETNSWRQIEYEGSSIDTCKGPLTIVSPTIVDQNLHWIFYNADKKCKYLFVFDPVLEKFHEMPLPENLKLTSLSKLGGKLIMTNIMADDNRLEVWRLENYTKIVWVKLYIIDDLPMVRDEAIQELWKAKEYYIECFLSGIDDTLYIQYSAHLVLYNLANRTYRIFRHGILDLKIIDLYKECIVDHDFFKSGGFYMS